METNTELDRLGTLVDISLKRIQFFKTELEDGNYQRLQFFQKELEEEEKKLSDILRKANLALTRKQQHQKDCYRCEDYAQKIKGENE